MITKDQYQFGLSLLSQFLKRINIKIDGSQVIIEQVLEFPNEAIAESFAKSYKEALEGK